MPQGKILYHGPMVNRSRHRPFTAVTRVRFPVGSPENQSSQQAGLIFFCVFLSDRESKPDVGERRNAEAPAGRPPPVYCEHL